MTIKLAVDNRCKNIFDGFGGGFIKFATTTTGGWSGFGGVMTKTLGVTVDNKPTGGEGGTAPQPGSPGDAFFQIVGLMSASTEHRHLFLSDIEWLVLPPLALQQFRFFRVKGRPAAYISWAFLTGEAEERLLRPDPRLKPGDWNGGDRAWIVDVVMPFGEIPEAFKELKKSVFSELPVKMMRFDHAQARLTSEEL